VAFGRKTDEQQASAQADKLARQQAREQEQETARRAAELAQFWASPQGRARKAFQDGDRILQSDFEVMSQEAVIVSMVGSTNTSTAKDPTFTLNAIAAEGWDLITGSFVFVVQGEQSRDKFLASGQNVAVKGITMGYYLFRRSEDSKTTA
jgi:hypothetical protein